MFLQVSHNFFGNGPTVKNFSSVFGNQFVSIGQLRQFHDFADFISRTVRFQIHLSEAVETLHVAEFGIFRIDIDFLPAMQGSRYRKTVLRIQYRAIEQILPWQPLVAHVGA